MKNLTLIRREAEAQKSNNPFEHSFNLLNVKLSCEAVSCPSLEVSKQRQQPALQDDIKVVKSQVGGWLR